MNDRELSVDILVKITQEGAYNNIALKQALGASSLNAVQKAFVTEVVNGVLRNLFYLDFIIDSFATSTIKKQRPFIVNVLRTAAYQLCFMDKVPPSAVCNEAVKLAKKRGYGNLSGLVNALCRKISANAQNPPLPDKTNYLRYTSVRYSYPEWILKLWVEDITPNQLEEVCKVNSLPPRVTICVNTLKTTKASLTEQLSAVAHVTELPGNLLSLSKTDDITGLKAYNEGLFHVMDQSSYLAVQALNPKPDSTFIDLCAAPGGKTFLAAYMMNGGRLIANDIHSHKLGLLKAEAKRLGVSVETMQSDARAVQKNLAASADYVLVDAPCTGLGLIRKKPDIKYSKQAADIDALSALQREILQSAVAYLKPGGFLLYSTCTINKAENSLNSQWLTENFGLTPEELPPLPADINVVSSMKSHEAQLLPGIFNDGFYFAKFKKN